MISLLKELRLSKVFNLNFLFVIPCYNEQSRLNIEYFETILSLGSIGMVFVNDGSRDETKKILNGIVVNNSTKCILINLGQNIGKANAVRIGMLEALKYDSSYVGYLDADGAFPIEVIKDALESVRKESETKTSFWFSRVKLAGSNVERNWKRHYFGRVLVTVATIGLTTCPYDTQAGLKIFTRTEIEREIWEEPFKTNWLFDIEILLRLSERNQAKNMLEIPVKAWKDVKGSKLKLSSLGRIVRDLTFIMLLKKQYLRSKMRSGS